MFKITAYGVSKILDVFCICLVQHPGGKSHGFENGGFDNPANIAVQSGDLKEHEGCSIYFVWVLVVSFRTWGGICSGSLVGSKFNGQLFPSWEFGHSERGIFLHCSSMYRKLEAAPHGRRRQTPQYCLLIADGT